MFMTIGTLAKSTVIKSETDDKHTKGSEIGTTRNLIIYG